jgi:hypothetical protein
MANRAQAQYLRLFDESATYYRWQNFYFNQTVTWDSVLWNYHPFVLNAMVGTATQAEAGITVTIPATYIAVNALQNALDKNWLCELKMYEFDSRLSQAAPQSGQLLIGTFIGEVIGIGGSFTELDVSIGSSLAPVGAQVPPRSFSSRLVGNPIKL